METGTGLKIGVIGGAGRLPERRDDCPTKPVRPVLDHRGTTAAAREKMLPAGFGTAAARGLTATFEKSVRMGDAS